MVREGLFASSGVIGLTTVFLATGLYLTALRIQKKCEHQENVRRRAMEAALLYASPERSGGDVTVVMPMERAEIGVGGRIHDQLGLGEYSARFSKEFSFV